MDGYIYCFSNPSMMGILKIGMTNRTPEDRLSEANRSDTWRPPTPYKIEIAKRVMNPKDKEETLHKLLTQYTERINPKREFFRVSIEEVRTFFHLIDGEEWSEKKDKDEDSEEEYEEEEDGGEEEEEKNEDKKVSMIGCRDMSKCFKDGQRIRHIVGINKTWIGIYNSSKNGILYDGKYLSLNRFAVNHYRDERPDRVSNVNAWRECECEIDGKWFSTYNLS